MLLLTSGLKLRRLLFLPPALGWSWIDGWPKLYYRGTNHSIFWIEILIRQISWWLLRPIAVFFLKRLRPIQSLSVISKPYLPRSTAIFACWLNCFTPLEVYWWQALGITKLSDLLNLIPNYQSGLLHIRRRESWPQKCRPASQLLADKAALLSVVPAAWRPPSQLLTETSKIPEWWFSAFEGEGLILKPRVGNTCRGVILYRIQNHQLVIDPLFQNQTASTRTLSDLNPIELLKDWRSRTKMTGDVLAMPYLQHHSKFPATAIATVLRIITYHASESEPIQALQAWLEIPLKSDHQHQRELVVLMDLTGQTLPLPSHRTLSSYQQQELEKWKLSVHQMSSQFKGCLHAAVVTHRQLPPIDAVAWDWILTDKGPKVLEGNSGFSILEPQLFAVLKNRMGKLDINSIPYIHSHQ